MRDSEIEQLSRPEMWAWCSDKDMKYMNSCTTQGLMNGHSILRFIDNSLLSESWQLKVTFRKSLSSQSQYFGTG